MTLKSPFPYFGGKSKIASVVWERLGNVPSYVEPFFGSGAVLLNRPHEEIGLETVNDLDCYLANFWRAIEHDPETVAFHADNPVNENDLHARHAWLVLRKEDYRSKIEGDPEYYDAKAAGWWCWGLCCWIGGGFCSGNGPWSVVDGQLVHLGDKGRGVNRQLVHLGNKGRGVNRQLVHLGNKGQGVNRQLVHLGDKGKGVNRQRVHLGNKGQGLIPWFTELANRLKNVRVCCGDWSRVCGPTPTIKVASPCGVFLDPPYADTATRTDGLYAHDDLQVAHAVREWAIENGKNKEYRIVLAGYDGEHQMPENWECIEWKASGGYGSQGSQGSQNAVRERLWCSPNCIKPVKHKTLF